MFAVEHMKRTLAIVVLLALVLVAWLIAARNDKLADVAAPEIANPKESSDDTVFCDESGNRYASEAEARAAGLADTQFGATFCSEYQAGLHPSWDLNQDGLNDCEDDGSCDHTVDYSQPRP